MTTTAPFEIKISIPTAVIENALDTGFNHIGKWWGKVVDLKYPEGADHTVPIVNKIPAMNTETWCVIHAGGTAIVHDVEADDPTEIGARVYEVLTQGGEDFTITRSHLVRDFVFPDGALDQIDELDIDHEVTVGNDDLGWYSVTRLSGQLRSFDRASIDRGLLVLATTYAHHFVEIVADNADSESGDALIQAAIFGELVYG